MKIKYLGIGAILLILVIVAGVLFMGGKTKNKMAQTQSNQTEQNVQNNGQNANPTQAVKLSVANVTVTNAGFVPNVLKIKAGTQVEWLNQSDQAATINSDVHPTHLLWPFLNLGSFDKGSTISVIFQKAGTYTYHNHYNPDQKGTVIVE